jgi:hypothetical protein
MGDGSIRVVIKTMVGEEHTVCVAPEVSLSYMKQLARDKCAPPCGAAPR